MKFYILIHSILMLVACGKEQENTAKKGPIRTEEFLSMVMNTKEVYWNEDSVVPKKIVLLSTPYPWHQYAFHIPDSIIPKEQVPAEHFFTDANGVYMRHFIFRDKKLNKVLENADKKFMHTQAAKRSQEWKFAGSSVVTIIDSLQDKKYDKRYVYSQPVFSNDSTIALVKKLVYWRAAGCVAECETGKVSESTHYFERDRSGNWKYFGGSEEDQ